MILGHNRRTYNPEAQDTLKKITALQSIFGENTIPPFQAAEGAGFRFLSRICKGQNDQPNKVKEKASKSVDNEDVSVAESKSSDTVQTSTSQHNSEKNRRYALSLATLSTKPGKRISIVEDGGLVLLNELAALHDKVIQLRCASAFASLTTETSIRIRMLDDGCLPAIISLATNTIIREIKLDCARAICNLCCVSGYEYKLTKDGVPFTIMNIAAACPDIYSICLQALLNISCVNDKFSRIEDLTEALMYFNNLNNMEEEQEILLLSAFCNLSALRNNQLRLVEDGCLRIVEKYYGSKYVSLRRLACEMLKNFTADYRSRAKLIEINIIPIVANMSKDKDEEIRITSAKCFLFLSKDRNFRKKIIRSDAFSLIMESSRHGKRLDSELGQILSKILKILCSDVELAERLVYSNIGDALVSLMESEDFMILQFCTESICSLFQNRTLMAYLIQDRVHEVIVRLAMKTTVTITKEWCSFALYQLIDSRLCDHRTIEFDILPCILRLCGHNLFPTHPSSSIASSNNLNTHPHGTGHHGLRSGDSESNLLTAGPMIGNIAAGAQRPTILAKGAATSASATNFDMFRSNNGPALPTTQVQLESEDIPPSYLTMSYGAAALAIITLYTKINFKGTIHLLVKMLNIPNVPHTAPLPNLNGNGTMTTTQDSGNVLEPTQEAIKKFCAKALFNLSKYEDNCLIILQESALPPIIQLTKYSQVNVICAGILSRLSLYAQFYKLFAEMNVLKVLLELSIIDDRFTQRRVVNALSNLSQDAQLCSQLLQLNPISYIISLASERDEYLRRGCIAIVCNMSYLQGSEKPIVDAGIIPTLMITSLIATDQVISRIICVKALVNLMADRTLYTSMVKDGAIWAMSKLALLEDEELLELCANALCRMSCEAKYAKIMVASSICIRTILNLIHRNNLRLQKPGARILTNLLLITTEADEHFRQVMVENMGTLASSQDEELNELCVVCLCLTSQSETCRITIVSSGMLLKIDPSIIFSSNRIITYAYITMFSNIANNPKMRTKVMDDHFLSHMKRILLLQDELLNLAVMKALYIISCAAENIPRLIQQDVLPFILDMLIIPQPKPVNGSFSDPMGSADSDGSVTYGMGCFPSMDPNHNISNLNSPMISNRNSYDEFHGGLGGITLKGMNGGSDQGGGGGSPSSVQSAPIDEMIGASKDIITQQPTTTAANTVKGSALEYHPEDSAVTSSSSMHHHPNMPTIDTNHPAVKVSTGGQLPSHYFPNRVASLSTDFIHHLIACLYNLTTNPDWAHKLVSDHITSMFLLLWPEAKKDNNMANLMILAICHLASGKSNTRKLVEDGCSEILCFVAEHRKVTKYAHYTFSLDTFLRVSIAMRNLLSIVSNQEPMIAAGCLDVLISLALNSFNRLPPQTPTASGSAGNNPNNTNNSNNNNNNNNTMINFNTSNTHANHSSAISAMAAASSIMSGPGSMNNPPGSPGSITSNSSTQEIKQIKYSCAVALKSLTFNQSLRPLLVNSPAIDIILLELRKENEHFFHNHPTIQKNLLKELEAESWDNGNRVKQKEGRYKALPPAEVYADLLLGVSKIDFTVDVKDTVLEKYHVQFLLEDDEDTATTTNGQGATTNDTAAAANGPQPRPSFDFTNGLGTSSGSGKFAKTNTGLSMSSTNLLTQGNSSGGEEDDDSIGGLPPTVASSSHAARTLSPINSMSSHSKYNNSSSFRRNKLKKLYTKVNLINSSTQNPSLSATATDEEMNRTQDNTLSMERLISFEDNDDALGLIPQRYKKQTCDVTVNTHALIRIEHIDDPTTPSSSQGGNVTSNNTIANSNTATAAAASLTATNNVQSTSSNSYHSAAVSNSNSRSNSNHHLLPTFPEETSLSGHGHSTGHGGGSSLEGSKSSSDDLMDGGGDMDAMMQQYPMLTMDELALDEHPSHGYAHHGFEEDEDPSLHILPYGTNTTTMSGPNSGKSKKKTTFAEYPNTVTIDPLTGSGRRPSNGNGNGAATGNSNGNASTKRKHNGLVVPVSLQGMIKKPSSSTGNSNGNNTGNGSSGNGGHHQYTNNLPSSPPQSPPMNTRRPLSVNGSMHSTNTNTNMNMNNTNNTNMNLPSILRPSSSSGSPPTSNTMLMMGSLSTKSGAFPPPTPPTGTTLNLRPTSAQQKSKDDDDMRKIVMLIKKARDSQQQDDVGEVLSKWREISQF